MLQCVCLFLLIVPLLAVVCVLFLVFFSIYISARVCVVAFIVECKKRDGPLFMFLLSTQWRKEKKKVRGF